MDEGQVLESWKEISSFLGRDVRTCMRWERDLGLPVHRLDGSPRARVFAFKDELDTWLNAKLHEHDGEHGPAGSSSAAAASASAAAVPAYLRLGLKLGLVRLVPSGSPAAPLAARPRRVSLRLRFFVAAGISAVALAALVYRLIVPSYPPPLPPGYVQPVLAVLTFENKSGDPALDHWRDSLTELVVAQLSQSRYMRVITTDQMLTALRRLSLAEARVFSSDDIARIALHTQAGHVLRGSFVKAGSTLVITVGLNQTSPVRPVSPALKFVAHSDYDVIKQADKLARAVKKSLRLTRAQIVYDFAKEASEAVTPSPEALRLYVEGRRLQLSNRWPEAIASMEKAIAIDPEFAMAYRTLAVAQRDLGLFAEARASIRKALEFGARLPDGEREFIEGQLAFWADDYAKTIEILEGLLKTHRGHLNAMTYLGYAYNGAGDIDKAIEYQRLVTRDRNSVVDVRTLAGYLQRQGRYQESVDLLRSFIQNVEDAWNVRQILAYSYGYLRDFDEALAEARITFQGNPRMRAVEFEMLVFMDDLAGAEALTGLEQVCLDRGRFAANIDYARKALVKARAQGAIDDVAAANRRLAFALEKAGRYAEALAEHGEYLRLAAESRASAGQTGLPYRPFFRKPDLFVKGRIQAEMGDAGEALKTAEELKSVIDSGINRKELKYYEYILGLVELGKGNPARAAELFGSACERLDFEDYWTSEQAIFLDRYGEALRGSGDFDKARETYEKITLLTTGRRDDGDIYARAYYWLGKIAERKGDAATARGCYGKFLALWKDADPGLPEVADAQARLAGR